MNQALPLLVAAAMVATLAPAASAQEDPTALGLEVGALAAPLPPNGAGQLPFNVTVGCALFLTAGGAALTVEVAAVDAPSTLTVAAASIEVAPDPACLTGAGALTVPGEVTITPGTAAPGLQDIAVSLQATGGGATSDTVPATVQVAYRPGHRITPDVRFPLEVHGAAVAFNLTLEFSANARSMIMFEEVKVDAGSIKGLKPIIAQPPATQVLQVTYTPPAGAWTTANVTFYNYSHYLLESGAAGGPELEARPTWTFINAAEEHGHDESGEDSPAPLAPVLGALLLGLALARRRKEA